MAAERLQTASRQELEVRLTDLLGLRIRSHFPQPDQRHAGLWVDAVFTRVAQSVKRGDTFALSIACDLSLLDPLVSVGKLNKSNFARSLRKNHRLLMPAQRSRVIDATFRLLALPFCPRELEDYVKLVKKFPNHEYADQAQNCVVMDSKSKRLLDDLLLTAAKQVKSGEVN